ncbi:MAG TPA: helix-turn-helix transcriptional regulator [Kofleriaceae bacterium]|jgi:DNA-binding Xre family transcriptional regulator
MFAIEQLKRRVQRAVPGVELELRKPLKLIGSWWLDATLRGHHVTVEWRPKRGFGISTDDPDAGFGEGPDEVITDRATAAARVVELLRTRSRTRPPSEVVLRELRALVNVTQAQLAQKLGVQQAAISRLESRSDITLSSLQRYVDALDGELEINVRTADGRLVTLLTLRADRPRRRRRRR